MIPTVRHAPRPLSPDEDRVLARILDADFLGVAALREQVDGLAVVGRCACGCPSIHLEPDPRRPRSEQPGRLAPVELLVAPAADEPPGGVILFVDDGRLSYLEYVYYSATPPTEWPPDDRLSRVGIADRDLGHGRACLEHREKTRRHARFVNRPHSTRLGNLPRSGMLGRRLLRAPLSE